MLPTWAVVATVDEPAPLVTAFVAHHLNEGAQAVHLYLDKNDRATVKSLRDMPGCILTRCNNHHWRAHNGGRHPYLHTRRQILNANVAYQTCRADWLIHCDADEFIRSGAALAADLAELPADCDHARLAVAERVMPPNTPQNGLFDGLFRLPVKGADDLLAEIYQSLAVFLENGLTGHPSGKAAVRTGRDLKIGIHQPRPIVPSVPLARTHLLHFDGLTAFHYLVKLLRRAHEKPLPGAPRHSAGRMAQIVRIKDIAHDPAAFRALADGLKSLTPDQLARLAALDLIDLTAFQPNLGTLTPDLSVGHFDDTLRTKLAAYFTEIGFDTQPEPQQQPQTQA